MISFFVSLVLLLNVENSFDDKKQASSIKKTVQIIKTIHGVKWGDNMKYLIIFLLLFACGNEDIQLKWIQILLARILMKKQRLVIPSLSAKNVKKQ